MAYRITLRRDTSLNWSNNNPVLLSGEPGYETDLGGFKIGDGSTPWTDLIYIKNNLSVNSQTQNYTLTLSDTNSLVEIESPSNLYFTIPEYSSVPFSVGTEVLLVRGGTGSVGITGASGVTLNSMGNHFDLQSQYASAKAINKSQNVWYLFGDLN
jgi:hypothetical protein